jgi:hypothetical protein
LIKECCKFLADRIQPNSANKGIVAMQSFNFANGTVKTMLAYKTGKRNDPPILLNFCPWCGKKIEVTEEKDKCRKR